MSFLIAVFFVLCDGLTEMKKELVGSHCHLRDLGDVQRLGGSKADHNTCASAPWRLDWPQVAVGQFRFRDWFSVFLSFGLPAYASFNRLRGYIRSFQGVKSSEVAFTWRFQH